MVNDVQWILVSSWPLLGPWHTPPQLVWLGASLLRKMDSNMWSGCNGNMFVTP